MSEEECIKERYKKRESKRSWYSFFNPGYLFIMQEREKALLAILKQCGMDVLDDKIVLDVGCGNGQFLRDLMKYGAKVENLYGVDLLEERIRRASTAIGAMKLRVGNAERLEFDKETFDIVNQSMMFSSILDNSMRMNIAREMLRVLKNDGIIIWYDFYINNPMNHNVRGIRSNEICDLFNGCNIYFKKVTLLPPISRLVAPFSYILCSLLQKIPFLLSHYYVVITK